MGPAASSRTGCHLGGGAAELAGSLEFLAREKVGGLIAKESKRIKPTFSAAGPFRKLLFKRIAKFVPIPASVEGADAGGRIPQLVKVTRMSLSGMRLELEKRNAELNRL